MVNSKNKETLSPPVFGRRCFRLRRFNPHYGADAVRFPNPAAFTPTR